MWEAIDGALTDDGTELFWAVFGNPTRNTGCFREGFAGGRFAHRWAPWRRNRVGPSALQSMKCVCAPQ